MAAIIPPVMQAQGVKRLVCMSSLGVGETRKLGNLVVRYVTGVVLRHVLVDKACQEKLIEHSKLQWTIVRPPRIMNHEISAPLLRWQNELGGEKPRWQVSKLDAALEMLKLLEDPSSIGATWNISY